jgi:hypothetical protein
MARSVQSVARCLKQADKVLAEAYDEARHKPDGQQQETR